MPVKIQKRAIDKLGLYENDHRHPSLRVKKMEGAPNIWEMGITKDYRITFQQDGNVVLLRNIGSHAILKRSKQ